MRLTTLQRKEEAHKDNIWAAKWVPKPPGAAADADLKLLTGSCDETCNLWR